MTKTAEPIATGPFHGFFHEGATLYRLDPPCVAGGYNRWRGVETQEVSHVIVSALPEDSVGNEAETVVFAANEIGVVNGDFYLKHGPVLELPGQDIEAALARLGYGNA